MPQNRASLPAPPRADTQSPSETAFHRSQRASRARRAAAARAARRRLRGRGGALVLCGVLALGGGSAVAAGGGESPKAAKASSSDKLSGATIRAAQRELGVEADGQIGPVTRAAIRDHQRAEDLEVTGRLDRATLASLGLRARAASRDEAEGGAAHGEQPKDEGGKGSAIPADVRAALERIAECESGGNPKAVSADGTYRGKYQFSRPTWRSVGGKGDPAKASEREQDRRAAKLYQREGSSPWPTCG